MPARRNLSTPARTFKITEWLRLCHLSYIKSKAKGKGTARALCLPRRVLLFVGAMGRVPGREEFTAREWGVVESHPTPARVQRYLSRMPYNWEKCGGTLRTFREVLRRGEAHCLEAA